VECAAVEEEDFAEFWTEPVSGASVLDAVGAIFVICIADLPK